MNSYIFISAVHDDGWGEAGNIGLEGVVQALSIEEAITRFGYRPFDEEGVWEACLMDNSTEDEYLAWNNSKHVQHELVAKKVQAKAKERAFKFYNVALWSNPKYIGYLGELFQCWTVLEITPDGNVTMYPDGTKFSLQDNKPNWGDV